MAARRDEWLSRAEAKRPDDVEELLASLRDTSVPKLEHRLVALTHFPVTPAIGDAAAEFLNDFPLKVAENLTLAAVAVGLVVLHGSTKVKRDVKVLERLAPWRAQVVDALARLKAPRKSLEDLDARLAVLSEGAGTKITAKAAELIDVTRDARIAEAAVKLLERPPVKFDAANAYFTVAALLLVAHGGPAQKNAAVKVAEKLVQLSWLERALPDDDANASVKRQPAQREDDFLSLIAEAPKDETRVAVFADWLLERGDPRGDFIVQQRAGKSGAALQKKHEKQWLRSLGRGAKRGATVFRGGLPREVFLFLMRPADVPLPDDPVLATLEALELVSYLPVEPLLTSPLLTSLKALTATHAHLAAAAPSVLKQLHTIGIRAQGASSNEKPLETLALAPNATTLKLVVDWREPEHLEPLPDRITALDVEAMYPAPWFFFAERLETLDVRPAYAHESEDGKRRVHFHFEKGKLTRVSCDARPDERSLELFFFEPLQSLTRAQRRGAVADVKFTPEQQARFDSLCG
ncbi:MAG: TIGR02996 domain-containing protein [Archangium sp.]